MANPYGIPPELKPEFAEILPEACAKTDMPEILPPERPAPHTNKPNRTQVPTIGLVADVQGAALKPDARSDDGERTKAFASALPKLGQAVDAWRSVHKGEQALECVLSLGDIVEGHVDTPTTLADLDTVLGHLGRLTSDGVETVHVVGNHCLKHIPRGVLLGRLGQRAAYFRRHLSDGWTLLVLDTTDLSHGDGRPEGAAEHAERDAFVAATEKAGWPLGEGYMQRYNGAVSKAQLAWLEAELAGCKARGERVVVASHHCLVPGACRETHRCWNGEAVAKLLVDSSVVALALAGHDHTGGHAEILYLFIYGGARPHGRARRGLIS